MSGTSSDEDDVPLGAYLQPKSVSAQQETASIPILVTSSTLDRHSVGSSPEPTQGSTIRPGRQGRQRNKRLSQRLSLVEYSSEDDESDSTSSTESSSDEQETPNDVAVDALLSNKEALAASPLAVSNGKQIIDSVQEIRVEEPVDKMEQETVTAVKSLEPAHLHQKPAIPTSPSSPVADFMASLLADCAMDMRDPLALYFSLSQKHYLSGFVYKKSELGSDGKLLSRHQYGAGQVDHGGEWCKWWVELHGCVLLLWKVPDDIAKMTYEPIPETEKIVFMELSPLPGSVSFIKSCHESPIFINVMDAVLEVLPHPYQPPYSVDDVDIPPPPLPYNNYLALSTAGSNLYLFASPSSVQCNSWVSAMTLASFEMRKICELYTYRLLKRPSYAMAWTSLNIPAFKTETFKEQVLYEGELNIRLTFSSEWRQCYVVVTSSRRLLLDKEHATESKGFFSKKKKKETAEETDIPEKRGHILVYETQKDVKRNRPLMHAPQVSSVHGVWPEKHQMIEMGIASVAKIEGTFLAVPNEQDPVNVKKKTQKKGAIDPANSAMGLNPNIIFGGISSLSEMVTGKNAGKERPHPEHMHFMAKNSVEMAKWIIAIQAAFNLPSDLSSMERALDEGAVGFVRQEFIQVVQPVKSPQNKSEDLTLVKDQATGEEHVQVAKEPATDGQAGETTREENTSAEPVKEEEEDKKSSPEVVKEEDLDKSSIEPVKEEEKKSSPEVVKDQDEFDVKTPDSAPDQPPLTDSMDKKDPVPEPKEQQQQVVEEPQTSIVSQFVSTNPPWGFIFLTAAEVGSIPMHYESVTPDNPISTDAITKAKFETLLADKTRAWKEGYLQQWSMTVTQAEAGRRIFEQKEVESKVKDLIAWLKLLLPESFTLDSVNEHQEDVKVERGPTEPPMNENPDAVSTDDKPVPSPPPIFMAVPVLETSGECVWQYRYVPQSYYDAQLKSLQDAISGANQQEEKRNKKKSRMLSKIDFTGLAPIEPGQEPTTEKADPAEKANLDTDSPIDQDPQQEESTEEEEEEDGETDESGDVSDEDSEDDQPLALPQGMVMGPDGLLMFAPNEDEDERLDWYQPDSLIAQRDRELREKGQMKRYGPLVQLNAEEMLLQQMKTINNKNVPNKNAAGVLMEFDAINNPYIANSLLATDRAPVADNRLSKDGRIVSMTPMPDMYQPNSLLSQQPDFVAPDRDMKRINLDPQPEFFGQNSLLAQAKMQREMNQNRASFIPEGPLLGHIDKDEKKVRLEGGLLGEMNRREKEKEYLKKMGMYQSLQPPRMPGQPAFPMMPTITPTSTTFDSNMQMQMQLQQMQMQMQMMQMQMGMAPYASSPMMMPPSIAHNPMMAGPSTPYARSEMNSDDIQSVVYRNNLKEQFLEKERAKERERMNERTEEWSKQLGFKPYPWMAPPAFDSRSFSDGVSEAKGDAPSGTESGDSGTEDEEDNKPILAPKQRQTSSSDDDDDDKPILALKGSRASSSSDHQPLSQLAKKVTHIPSGSETESTEQGSESEDSDDEPLAKPGSTVPSAMNRMAPPVPPVFPHSAPMYPGMNPYGQGFYPGMPMQGMPPFPYGMPPPGQGMMPPYPYAQSIPRMPPYPYPQSVPGMPPYPYPQSVPGMPPYPYPQSVPGFPMPPSFSQPTTIPDGESDSDDEPILKRK